MQKNIIEPRYKVVTDKIITSYKNELVSLDEIECFLGREFETFRNAKRLTGGRISGVYKVNDSRQDKVIKYSKGTYRMLELKREAEVLKYMNDKECKYLVPIIRNFRILDNFAYLVQDYFDGETVREKLDINHCSEARSKIWELVGQALSKIHMLCKSEDIKGEWLNEQLKTAKINMQNDLIDIEDFGEETPKEVLQWLMSNKPDRKQVSLLHGDFRTKNIMMDEEDNCKIIDWAFVDIGDHYYDLAVIDYYFKDELDRNSFYKGYKNSQYDKRLSEYYDRLSWFINV